MQLQTGLTGRGRRAAAIVVSVVAAGALLSACSDSEAGPPATPTPVPVNVVVSTPTTEPPTPVPEPTATPQAAVEAAPWGPEAIWDVTVDAELLKSCGVMARPECIVEHLRASDAPSAALEFFLTEQTFLIAFEELGVVDFGAVAVPWSNMGRPEPVFLNGAFGLLYPGALVPEDWLSRVEAPELPENIVFWSEYGLLEYAGESSRGQFLTLQMPVQQCRACEVLGYLVVEYGFDEAGRFLEATVVDLTPVAMAP